MSGSEGNCVRVRFCEAAFWGTFGALGSHIFTPVHHYELNTFRTRSRGNPKTRDS